MDLSALNPQQRAAVTAADGAQLIIAGAGTGKTNTLVHRVAWLLEHDVPPQQIVLLTFTRRAAAEMLSRAAQLVGPGARRVRGGTFHGFANSVLRRYAEVLDYGRDFTILDSADAQALVGLVRGELGIAPKGRRFPKRGTVLKILSKQVNTGRELRTLIDEDFPQYVEDIDDIARIGQRYRERKRSQNVLDYDDLLVRLLELLRDHEAVRARISDGCRYVLVDEYQDTNRLQAQIGLLLSIQHGNLMVVGDEAQSIYGFRGALVSNILDFPTLLPACNVLKLEQNYRSTQAVLDLANGVLDSATEGYDKRLFSDGEPGPLPVEVTVDDIDQEAEWMVERILELHQTGIPLRQIAVLFRSGFHANLLELALDQARLPFRKFGGIQFVEAAHVKDFFALLRLVANPRDGLAWSRVLQWSRGLGPTGAQRMVAAIAEGQGFDPTPYKRRKYYGELVSLAAMLKGAAERQEDLPALVAWVSDYYKPKLLELYEDGRRRERDLETLALLATKFSSLEQFLTEVTLDPPNKSEVKAKDTDGDWLSLSTIHSAKGLEWHTVFVVGLVDGRFPSFYSLEDDHAIEEERRLFYVAITRAKVNLLLLRPEQVQGRFFGSDCLLLDEIEQVDRLLQHEDGAAAPELSPPESSVSGGQPDLDAAKQRMAAFLQHFSKR